MAGEGSERAGVWVVRVCPSCQGKCRARPGATALRCPRCGATFFPASATEPARPSRSRLPRQAALEPEESPYAARDPEATRPVAAPEADVYEDLAVRRKRPPAPVAPLWLGVYGFPWHPCALRAWFLFGAGLSIVALMGGALHYVIDLYLASDLGRGSIWVRVLILYTQGFVAFLLWTGAYAGNFFLATIQDTAAGNPDVRWPDDSVWEGVFTFLYLVWIFLCAAVPFGIAVSPLEPSLGYRIFSWSLIPSAVLVFPFVLLCALSNNSWWQFWDTDIVVNLLVRPHVLLILYMMSALLLAPCIALGYLTIVFYDRFLFLAPLTGFVWSACLLIYGRLLGRVGWVIGGGPEEAAREARRRRRRRRPADS